MHVEALTLAAPSRSGGIIVASLEMGGAGVDPPRRSLAWDLLLPPAMRKSSTALIAHLASFAAVSAMGCQESADSTLASDPSDGARGVSNESQRPDTLSMAPAHAAAVHLLLDDSIIRPWCGGVLVAPDVVITSADCVVDVGGSRLEIGTMVPGSDGEHAVEQIVALERDPRLAALVLEHPIEGIEPASIAVPEGDECGVQSVSYLYVSEPKAPLSRWVWSGCYSEETAAVEPIEGEPNCHGDNGAPVFDEEGYVIGVVVAASVRELCVDEVILAGPGSGAYDEALELSR